MGRFDHVPSVLRELGVAEVFRKVAQRPGKPIWFGIGRPGRPCSACRGAVSALVCLLRYALPAIYGMLGARPRAPEHVPLGAAHVVKDSLWHFLPVRIEQSPALGLVAMPRPTRGSGDFVSARHRRFRRAAPGPARTAGGLHRRCTGGDAAARGEDNPA